MAKSGYVRVLTVHPEIYLGVMDPDLDFMFFFYSFLLSSLEHPPFEGKCHDATDKGSDSHVSLWIYDLDFLVFSFQGV